MSYAFEHLSILITWKRKNVACKQVLNVLTETVRTLKDAVS